jgi:DNA-binding NtrC family response regulator
VGHTLNVLVVDDEAVMREVLRARLEDMGYEVLAAATAAEATRLVAAHSPAMVISDVVLPDLSGLELLESLKGGDRNRPVILMTAYGSVDMAVEAMKQGATDFLTKPLDWKELEAALAETSREIAERQVARELDSVLTDGVGLGPLVGSGPAMHALFELVQTLAASDASAIITGESGTGKELVARTLHDLSARRGGPFIAINAAAIPESLMESELFGHEKGAFTGAVAPRAGCFELSHGGTLFLDEITEMPVALQPKLLRVLEGGRLRRVGGTSERSFDVRVLAATNRDPEVAIGEQRLRPDLYYRLGVFTVALPPLRERREDIPLLAQSFIRRANEKHGTAVEGLRPQVHDLLLSYSWPGNVRELSNVVERAVILARGGWIETIHLPALLRKEGGGHRGIFIPSGVSAAEAERILILETLRQTGNNKAQAARRLGLDVKTIRNKLKSWGDERALAGE